jgi:hypothetical protein
MATARTSTAGWLDQRRRVARRTAVDFAKGASIGTLVIAALWLLL